MGKKEVMVIEGKSQDYYIPSTNPNGNARAKTKAKLSRKARIFAIIGLTILGLGLIGLAIGFGVMDYRMSDAGREDTSINHAYATESEFGTDAGATSFDIVTEG